MCVERTQNKMAKQCDGTTQQSLPTASRDCCGSITLLVSLLFKPVTNGQHPYMQLVSVLCVPVHASSIPTSISLSFLPLFQSFYQLNNSTVTP